MLKRSLNLICTKRQLLVNNRWAHLKQVINKTKYEQEQSLNTQKKLTEEQKNKLYFAKDDPNVFGTLNTGVKDLLNENQLEDEGDKREEKLLQNPVPQSKKLSTKQYAEMIKTHLRKRQIKEAIDIVEIKMIEEDRVKPDNYIYNLLLGGCGRVGYTKKAFKLFNDMKKRDLLPTNGTYTALFNACSNSPWLEDGLSRATKLRELMIEKGVILNDTNYNAMIKAFGRCGDLKIAFSLVDEMIQNNISVKEDTLNFLLHSCISDKNAGFRHALLVWRKFHQKKIKPDIYSFNLMLRCVRDCSLGDVETMNKLLQSPEFKQLQNENQKLDTNSSVNLEVKTVDQYWPNLLAPIPHLGNLIQLTEIAKPEDRLLLVGGLTGFLQNMKENNVKPDIKTFTQLLDCIPGTILVEKTLLSAMKKEGIKFDVDFLNMLIKKRSMRFDYENAKDVVLTLFRPPKLRPDLITYGVLALGCETKEQANNLIEEMVNAGYSLNIEILGAMLKQACIKMNFIYVLELMQIAIDHKVKPNKIFIQNLEDLYKRSKHESKGQKGHFFTNGFRLFRMRYKIWLEEIEMDKSDEIHPWEQFRKPSTTNVKNFKDNVERFKPKIASRFKQKTGTRVQ